MVSSVQYVLDYLVRNSYYLVVILVQFIELKSFGLIQHSKPLPEKLCFLLCGNFFHYTSEAWPNNIIFKSNIVTNNCEDFCCLKKILLLKWLILFLQLNDTLDSQLLITIESFIFTTKYRFTAKTMQVPTYHTALHLKKR